MAFLYRPKYTRDIPPHARPTVIGGVPHVRWTARGGREILASISPSDPSKCVVESPVWWVEYRDHENARRYEKCYRDREASERKRLDIMARVDRVRAGQLSPASQASRDQTLTDLIGAWTDAVRAKDVTGKQWRQTKSRVTKIAEGVRAASVAALTTRAVNAVLKSWRDTRTNFSPQTSNHYLSACRSFTSWCVRSGYVDFDPLADAAPVECDSRRTFERRALTPEEFWKLIEATEANWIPQCPLSGEDRAALYLTAAYTGFRVGELAHLDRRSFRLEGDTPTIVLPGRHTKNKKDAIQPIPGDVAAELAAWLAKVPGDVWPGYAWREGKIMRVMRLDLAAAGIVEETDEGVIDFHALRTTYITMLARAGVPVQHAQRFARHQSPNTTSKHYTRLGINDLGEQVLKFPPVPKPKE